MVDPEPAESQVRGGSMNTVATVNTTNDIYSVNRRLNAGSPNNYYIAIKSTK